jgi:hypothetical protein
MQTEIHVFDFDGTIFNSPEDHPDNYKKYEELTGIPWIITKETSAELTKKLGYPVKTRKGWWGKGETLEPPLVPNPAPIEWFNSEVVGDFIQSKSNQNAVTLLLTGRHRGLRNHVLRICNDANLLDENVECYFKGDTGPDPQGKKPNTTLTWKIWIIEQYIRMHPSSQKIVFWEDRENHVEHFRSLNGVLAKEVIVNHIKNQPPLI